MRVQEHIDKISWSLADKLLYIIYGVVLLFQMQALDPRELGLYALLITLHTWIFIISDSYALQNLIQFGVNLENRRKVNTVSLIVHIIVSLGTAFIIFGLKSHLSIIFIEPRLYHVGTLLPELCLIFIPRTYCIKLIFRDHEMKNLFFVNLAFFGTMAIITIYLLFTKNILNFNDMIVIYFSGSTVSSITSLILTRKKLIFGIKGNISVRKQLSFGIPLMLNGSLNSLPKQLDIYFVQYFFSTSVVGIYYAAKNLFRFFEETVNAAHGLVYPAAVRQLEKNNYVGFNDLMTKAVSFILLFFIIIIVVLEAGGSRFLITTFLPIKYHLAIGQFNLLILAALGLPLSLLSSIITALGKPYIIFKYICISIVFSLLTFYFVGLSQNPNLVPLGLMVYIIIFGILCYFFANKHIEFRFSLLYRALGDSYYYAKTFILKKRG